MFNRLRVYIRNHLHAMCDNILKKHKDYFSLNTVFAIIITIFIENLSLYKAKMTEHYKKKEKKRKKAKAKYYYTTMTR